MPPRDMSVGHASTRSSARSSSGGGYKSMDQAVSEALSSRSSSSSSNRSSSSSSNQSSYERASGTGSYSSNRSSSSSSSSSSSRSSSSNGSSSSYSSSSNQSSSAGTRNRNEASDDDRGSSRSSNRSRNTNNDNDRSSGNTRSRATGSMDAAAATARNGSAAMSFAAVRQAMTTDRNRVERQMADDIAGLSARAMPSPGSAGSVNQGRLGDGMLRVGDDMNALDALAEQNLVANGGLAADGTRPRDISMPLAPATRPAPPAEPTFVERYGMTPDQVMARHGGTGYFGLNFGMRPEDKGPYTDALKAYYRQSLDATATGIADVAQVGTLALPGFGIMGNSPIEQLRGNNTLDLAAGMGRGLVDAALDDPLEFGGAVLPGLLGPKALPGRRVETGARQTNLSIFDWDRAESVYSDIRTRSDVPTIAANTGLPEFQVNRIKDHVFNNDHILDDGVRRFDADPMIANAWNRLTDGTQTPRDMDLLSHELFESKFEGIFGTDYRTAHEAANRSGRTIDLYGDD